MLTAWATAYRVTNGLVLAVLGVAGKAIGMYRHDHTRSVNGTCMCTTSGMRACCRRVARIEAGSESDSYRGHSSQERVGDARPLWRVRREDVLSDVLHGSGPTWGPHTHEDIAASVAGSALMLSHMPLLSRGNDLSRRLMYAFMMESVTYSLESYTQGMPDVTSRDLLVLGRDKHAAV